MTYRVRLAPQAIAALEDFVRYIAEAEHAPLTASRWLQKALTALETLHEFPHRCPPAPESEHYAATIRMLIIDRCLFLYRIDEEAREVRVLDFRHAAQRPRELGDL